jgi:hypothetical protein
MVCKDRADTGARPPVMVRTAKQTRRTFVYSNSPADHRILGKLAAELLADPSWIHRRKEKVTLLDEAIVRRQMSVDFALPSAIPVGGTVAGQAVYYAPLLFLQKGADEPFDGWAPLAEPEPHYANFDFTDARGRSLSLPSRVWNAAVTGHMLYAYIEEALLRWPEAGDNDAELRDGLNAIAEALCSVDQLSAIAMLHLLRNGDSVTEPGTQTVDEDRLRRLDSVDSELRRILDVCAISSVVMVPLFGEESLAGILKISYDEKVTEVRPPTDRFRSIRAGLGWSGYEMWVETPYIGGATYHFEIEAPEGLEIYDAGLLEVDPHKADRLGGRYRPALDRVSGYTGRLHLYAHHATGNAKAMVWVRLRVRRQEFVAGAVLSGGLVALALWAAFVLHHQAAQSPASVPTLLLLFPSLIAGYVARPGPHPLTVRMLRYARWLVGFSAALSFVAAGFLALARRKANGEVLHPHFHWPWLVLAVVSTAVFAGLLAARLQPRPELERQQRAERRLERAKRWQQIDYGDPWVDRWRDGRLGRIAKSADSHLYRLKARIARRHDQGDGDGG